MSSRFRFLQTKLTEGYLKSPYVRSVQRLYHIVKPMDAIFWFFTAVISFVGLIFKKLSGLYLTIFLIMLIAVFLIKLILAERTFRKRISLTNKWQALAWAHYRQLLAEVLVKSATKTGESRFDFVTFFGGHFQKMLNNGFYSEIQYTRGSTKHLDLVIFDIEYLGDLREGLKFENDIPEYKLVPFEKFYDLETENIMSIPPQFQHALRPMVNTTFAIPLRWGFNGVALKLSLGSIELLKRTGITIDNNTKFDLKWITDETSPFYRWLRQPDEPCWVIALDWYLPTMMLFAWDLCPAGCHNLYEQHIKVIVERMNKLIPLMHPEEPLVLDPLRLAQRVHKEDNLIILGGGNWLNLVGQTESDTLKLLPTSSGYLLWCECMGFLAPNGEPTDIKWRMDANELVKWFIQKSGDVLSSSSFHAYSPTDMNAYQRTTTASPRPLVRQLPPLRSSGDYIVRKRWEEEWQNWHTALLSRSGTALLSPELKKS